jgi:hypothetical protein
MHAHTLVMWIALAAAIGIPLYMWRRRRDVLGGLHAFLSARGFVERNASPVAALTAANPPDGFHFSAAYAGFAQNVPVTLLILRRTEAVVVQGMLMQNQTIYLGAHLPAGVADEAFVADWRRKAQTGREHVVHASQPAEGGALIVWKGAPSRANAEAHVAALAGKVRGASRDLALAAHDS